MGSLKLPRKRYFRTKDPEFLSQRRADMEAYLDEVSDPCFTILWLPA